MYVQKSSLNFWRKGNRKSGKLHIWHLEMYINWWLVRVTLVIAWWLFAPKFCEVVGTYESLVCLKMNAGSVVVTCEVVGTLNHYKMIKKLNFTHLEVVGM